jgi:aryl-alcohol dehydrogenase-like predicted oxidoreductase
VPLDQVVEHRQLGSTDLKVSRVGFGGWPIGGHGWGPVEDQQSIRAVRQAFDLGVTLFDTADVYGFGHSEEIFCKALGEDRKNVVIASKFGVRWNERGETCLDATPGRVLAALEESLRRLKLDCLPLYQIHWPDPKTPIEETMGALKMCQRQGKIRYIGCSNFSVEMTIRADRVSRLASSQSAYNLVDHTIEAELLPCALRLGIGVIAHSPLAKGLLSGKFESNARFAPNDIRSRSKYFEAGEFEKNLKTVGRLGEVARRYGKTPAQVALRWILEHPAVTAVIPGIKTPQQAIENAGAMGWTLAREDYEFLGASACPGSGQTLSETPGQDPPTATT